MGTSFHSLGMPWLGSPWLQWPAWWPAHVTSATSSQCSLRFPSTVCHFPRTERQPSLPATLGGLKAQPANEIPSPGYAHWFRGENVTLFKPMRLERTFVKDLWSKKLLCFSERASKSGSWGAGGHLYSRGEELTWKGSQYRSRQSQEVQRQS